MIVTTGHNVDGYEIVEYLDILTAEVSLDASIAKLFKPLEITAGTVSKTHQGTFGQFSKQQVLEGLKYQAQSIGADAIISVSFQFIYVKSSYIEIFGTGTAVKIKKKLITNAPNHFDSSENAVPVNQNNLAQLSPEQIDEKMPIEYSENCIQILEYIVKNIEQFKNTQEIKDYYLKTVKTEDIDASLVQSMDKRIALERMYGSMKYDTKKDIEKILGDLH